MSSSMAMTPKDREDFKFSLAVEALLECGIVRLRAWGTSMLPSLWPGDLLTIHRATEEETVPGEIVLVVRDKRCFIHRLVEKRPSENGFCFLTRGDAIPGADPPVGGAELLGKVINVYRGSHSFTPSLRISLMDSAVAYALCRSDRLRSLALRWHAARMQGWRPTGRTDGSSLARHMEILSIRASHQ